MTLVSLDPFGWDVVGSIRHYERNLEEVVAAGQGTTWFSLVRDTTWDSNSVSLTAALGVLCCAMPQVELTSSDWDECGMWLTALKRLIKIRQTMG
jgi:hypothetical protein